MWKGPDRVANWVRTMRSSNVRSMFTSKYGAAQKAAVKPGFLYEFPWESLGGAKYVLYLPFLYIIAAGLDDADNFAFHMMMLVGLRYLQVRLLPPCIGALGRSQTLDAKQGTCICSCEGHIVVTGRLELETATATVLEPGTCDFPCALSRSRGPLNISFAPRNPCRDVEDTGRT